MKQYYIMDKDGKKLIKELDSGVRVEVLEEPSPEYIANFVPNPEPIIPPARDLAAELDQLKAEVEKIKQGIVRVL